MNKTSLFSTSFNSGSSATILWDLELCPVPKTMKGYQAVRFIKDYILSKGLQLTQIIAMGSSQRVPDQTKTELEDCGVSVQKLNSKYPAAGDISILHEIIKLVYFYRPPHSIVLISGDRDFSKILNFLDQVHYHVVFIHAKDISDVMKFSITDKIAWWELLGCQVTDIDFQPPFLSQSTLQDAPVTNPGISTGGLVLRSPSSLSSSSSYLPLRTNSGQGIKADRLKLEKPNGTIANIQLHKPNSNGGGSGSSSSSPSTPTTTGSSSQKGWQKSMNYDPLIEFLLKQPNCTSFFGDIGSNCRKIASSNGFSSLKEFLYQAEEDGIVALLNKNEKNGHITVKLAPSFSIKKDSSVSSTASSSTKPPPPPSSPNYDELVTLLQSSQTRSLTISDINLAARNINKRNGFTSLKAYVAAAEQAGIVRISGRDDRTGRLVVHLPKQKEQGGSDQPVHLNSKSTSLPRTTSLKNRTTPSQEPENHGGASNSTANINSPGNSQKYKKAVWDLIEFLKTMPDGQFVSVAHIIKYCPSILRKNTFDSVQELFYASKNLGLVDLKIEGDDQDLEKVMVQLLVSDSARIMELFGAAKTIFEKDLIQQNSSKAEQQVKASTDVNPEFNLPKQPLSVDLLSEAASMEPLSNPGDLKIPKPPTRPPLESGNYNIAQVDSAEVKYVVDNIKEDPKPYSSESEQLKVKEIISDIVAQEPPFLPSSLHLSVPETPVFAPGADQCIINENDFAFTDELDPYFQYGSESVKQSSNSSSAETVTSQTLFEVTTQAVVEKTHRVIESDETSGSSFEQALVKFGTAKFYWPHPGQSVAVTGTWDQWNSEILMVKQGNVWQLEKSLPVGRYEYEFVVDGYSMVDDNQEYVEDEESCHNIVFVS